MTIDKHTTRGIIILGRQLAPQWSALLNVLKEVSLAAHLLRLGVKRLASLLLVFPLVSSTNHFPSRLMPAIGAVRHAKRIALSPALPLFLPGVCAHSLDSPTC